MKVRKIRTRILAMILPVVCLSTVLLVAANYIAFQSRMQDETEQKMMAVLSTEAARISDQLHRDESVARAIASYISTTSKAELMAGEHGRFLSQIIPSNPNTIGGGIWLEPYYLGPNKEYFGPYYYRMDNGGYTLTLVYEGKSYDYPTTEWYLNGKASSGEIAWTDVYHDPVLDITMLTGAVPIFDSANQFIGMATADMDLQDIRQIVSDIRIGETGRAFMLSSKGQYIVFDETHTLDMKMAEDEDAELAALGQELMSGEDGSGHVRYNGESSLVYYTTIPGVGWKLAVVMDEAEIRAPVRSMTYVMLGITAVTLGAVIIAVMLITRHLHGIINRINEFSKAAASGQDAGHLELDTTDEFRSIAENMNIMLDNLHAVSDAKGQFLSRMSHEIRTPMNAIIGMTEIGKKAKTPEQARECLLRIEESSKHLLGIVNDILDYSKVESGKLALLPEMFSLSSDMDFVVSMFGQRAIEKGIELRLEMTDIRHDGIVADMLRLNQVLLNLLSNAVKFTPENGRITVTVQELGHDAGMGVYRFAVADTGIGIPKERQTALFEAFEQVDARVSSMYGGTGLGLTIAKRLVELMDGEVRLDSEPGMGSTFSFTIRVPAEESAGEVVARETDDGGDIPDCSGLRILVVDDIEINRAIVVELLRETGVETKMAADGKQALEMFAASAEGYYDLIFMDMQMPVMDGCAAASAIRGLARTDAKEVGIVAMTANVLREDVERALSAGMDAHIAKPVDTKRLYEVMREAKVKKDGKAVE